MYLSTTYNAIRVDFHFAETYLLHNGADLCQAEGLIEALLQEVAEADVKFLELQAIISLVGEGVLPRDDVELGQVQLPDLFKHCLLNV